MASCAWLSAHLHMTQCEWRTCYSTLAALAELVLVSVCSYEVVLKNNDTKGQLMSLQQTLRQEIHAKIGAQTAEESAKRKVCLQTQHTGSPCCMCLHSENTCVFCDMLRHKQGLKAQAVLVCLFRRLGKFVCQHMLAD